MRLSSTIALTALAAALVTPVAAEAKAKAHHKAAAEAGEQGLTAAEQLRQAQEQISQLQAQLNALSSKVDSSANSSAVASAQAQAAQAQATADKAVADAAAARAAAAKSEKAVKAVAWAADTTVGGTIFFDATTINQQANGVKTNNTGTGVNIKRAYITLNHKFNDVFSANITTDISNVAGDTTNTVNGANVKTGANTGIVGKGFYLKNAYLQAKIDPALWVRVGVAPLPWVPYIESKEGYRYIENVGIDRIGRGTSADWGVHVGGDLGKYISYQVSVIDGAGYRKAYVTNTVDIEGRISANYAGFFAAAGGYTGRLANNVQGTQLFHMAQRLDFAGGYQTKKFTLGGEYWYAKDFNGGVTRATEDSTTGFSVFGNYNLTPKWNVFGRYDWVRDATGLSTPGFARVGDHYFNTGLQYEPVKNVDLTLVYKRDVARGGTISTQNGTIGGALAGGGRGTYDEVGLFGKVSF